MSKLNKGDIVKCVTKDEKCNPGDILRVGFVATGPNGEFFVGNKVYNEFDNGGSALNAKRWEKI